MQIYIPSAPATDHVLVISWDKTDKTFNDVVSTLKALGFEVRRICEDDQAWDSKMLAIPLPEQDIMILSKLVHHVLKSRLGIWNTSSTAWNCASWNKFILTGEIKQEIYED